MNEETKRCLNCKRDIPSNNFEMHVVHCQRNIELCPVCNEPYASSELENHKLESHKIVTCPECYFKLQNSELSAHKTETCIKRIISCKHCNLELKADEIPEHEDYCGSRTEPCEGCGKLILLKFQEVHLDSNHKLTKPRDDSRSNSSESDNENHMVDTEENFRNNYSSRYGRNANVIVKKRGGASSNNSRAKYQDYDRKNRNRTPLNSLNDLNECFKNLDPENVRCSSSSKKVNNTAGNSNPSQHHDVLDETYIPCEFCETPIIADNLVLHETGCRPELVSFEPSQDAPIRSWVPQEARSDPSIYEISDDEEDDILIPCEFCKEPLPLHSVTAHQLRCRDD